MREGQQENTIDLMKYVKILWKRKYWIIGILVLGTVLSALFTSPLFIEPLYKSTIVFYPNNVQPKSDESPAEQVMQWCDATEIKDSIIRKYNFKDRYKKTGTYSQLIEKYNSNIKISINKRYKSISIDVLDKDPKIACQIANDIPLLVNQKITHEYTRNYKQNIDAVALSMEEKNKEIDSALNLLIAFGKDYNIFWPTAQGTEVTKGILGTVEGNKSVDKNAITSMKANLEQQGPFFLVAQQSLLALISEKNSLQTRYDALSINLIREYDFLSIVLKPYVNEESAYPSRIKSVILTIILCFLISCLFFILYDDKELKNFFKELMAKEG